MLCKRYHKKKNPASKEASQKSLSHADFLRVRRRIFQLETNYKNYATFAASFGIKTWPRSVYWLYRPTWGGYGVRKPAQTYLSQRFSSSSMKRYNDMMSNAALKAWTLLYASCRLRERMKWNYHSTDYKVQIQNYTRTISSKFLHHSTI